jgi:hypothetical protein
MGKKESEMQGLSVFFIASVLPQLIRDLGNVYGHFCGSNFCGKGVKDCPAGKGALSPDDARPYDIDEPLFREGTKDHICPRDGLPGCAFVDFIDVVHRPPCRQALCCIALPIACCPQVFAGEHTGPATIMISYTWAYTFGSIGSALMAYCAKHGLEPRTTRVWICCMCINQHRVAGGHRECRVWPAGVSFGDGCR